MQISPSEWDKILSTGEINPFRAIPSVSKEYSLDPHLLTAETLIIKQSIIEADTDFYSFERKKEFKFFDIKDQNHAVTK